jgi:hypothetical protein
VPEWARRLVERGEEPAHGSADEVEYCGWLFFNDSVPGLPNAESEDGAALLRPIRERADAERDRREQARRRALARELARELGKAKREGLTRRRNAGA